MTDKKLPAGTPKGSPAGMIDKFLKDAKSVAPVKEGDTRARLVFALDATMSRQPTWDLACNVQTELFKAAAQVGGLSVQLVYFRGLAECRASAWVGEPRMLASLMERIDCRGGQTQIGRVLRHVRNETKHKPIQVLVYVGDAMEEPIDDLCALAGELGLLGVKGFIFQEGNDAAAARAFREVARLTGGSYGRFDAGAPGTLAELLKAAAAYATRGREGLVELAATSAQARQLLTHMGGRA